jgi:predicted small lipoprotein YifL
MKLMPLMLLAALLTGAGCGQKGPLVLPDAQHPKKKVKLPAVPAPAATSASPEPGAPAGPASNPAPPDAAPGSSADPAPKA